MINQDALFQEIDYVPHEHQLSFHNSTKRFRVVAAGARAGKSMAAGAEVVKTIILPNKRIWICSSQYELAEKEFDWFLTFFSRLYWKKRRLIELCRLTSASRGSRSLITPWGSFVKTKSTEKAQTLLGEELDLLVLGEASQIRREPYERMLRARIGPRLGRLVAISTPNSDSGLFVEFFENGVEKKDGWESWQFRTIDNPHFPKEEYETAKKELDKRVFEEQYEGKFVSRLGKVFSVPKEILVDSPPKGHDSWSLVFSVFPAQNNPYIVVAMYFCHTTNRYYVHDLFWGEKDSFRVQNKNNLLEYMIEERSPSAYASKWIKEMSAGKKVVAVVANDWNYFCEELRSFGVMVTIPDSGNMPKTQKTIRQIQVLQDFIFSGRLTINRGSCLKLIDSVESITWSESNEEKNRIDCELPKDRNLFSAQALVNAIIFVEQAMGTDIYGGQ